MTDAYGQLPLHKLGGFPDNVEERIELTKTVIPRTFDINYQDKYGQNPLHTAATNGSAEIVKLLLKAGAKPNIQCEIGLLPIDAALTTNQAEVVKILAPITKNLNNPLLDYQLAKRLSKESWKIIQNQLRCRRKRKSDNQALSQKPTA